MVAEKWRVVAAALEALGGCLALVIFLRPDWKMNKLAGPRSRRVGYAFLTAALCSLISAAMQFEVAVRGERLGAASIYFDLQPFSILASIAFICAIVWGRKSSRAGARAESIEVHG